MAVAIPSVSTFGFTSTNTVTITKPSGTTEGDLLIAHLLVSGTPTDPADWTLFENTGLPGRGEASRLYWKRAGSSEPADYSWTFVDTNQKAGAIARVTGASSSPMGADNVASVNTDDTPSYANTVTPTVANSGLMLFVSSADNDNPTGGYAIANDDPTWAEQWDMQEGGENLSMAMAFATRAQTTATGNSSATGLDVGADSVGQILVINPATAASFSADPLILTLTPFKPNTPIAILSPLSFSLTIFDPTTAETAFKWLNTAKNSASFTNTSKNAASFTNLSKNSSSWSNQAKT